MRVQPSVLKTTHHIPTNRVVALAKLLQYCFHLSAWYMSADVRMDGGWARYETVGVGLIKALKYVAGKRILGSNCFVFSASNTVAHNAQHRRAYFLRKHHMFPHLFVQDDRDVVCKACR